MHRIKINGISAEYLPITDRSTQYGDGLFETIACRKSGLQFWDEHIRRMVKGADALDIEFPGERKYYQDIKSLLDEFPDEKYVIKLLLTRGSGGRGYRHPRIPKPARAVILYSWPKYPPELVSLGVNVCLCKHSASINPSLAGIKHLNRLDNVLARNEWGDEFHEGFMFDSNGNLIEGTMSNVFGIKNKTLFTPHLDQCGVRGIIRDQILSIAKEKDFESRIENITLENIYSMDEIFITNSIIGLWPVSSIGDKKYAVGDMTRSFERVLKQRIKDNAKTFT